MEKDRPETVSQSGGDKDRRCCDSCSSSAIIAVQLGVCVWARSVCSPSSLSSLLVYYCLLTHLWLASPSSHNVTSVQIPSPPPPVVAPLCYCHSASELRCTEALCSSPSPLTEGDSFTYTSAPSLA